MSKILIFAGTTEGRRLAEVLSGKNIECIVCVATEYGNEIMPELCGITKRTGRLDATQMVQLISEEKIETVIDATHPFATVVSENIKQACDLLKVKYLRLKRDTSAGMYRDDITVFSDSKSCAKALEETRGNILLTTGSKELPVYCENEQVKERLYVRVLPGQESMSICAAQDINKSHIIAMQGPFSQKLNEALIEQFDIKYLVTKESGRVGGLDEKILAAKNCGIDTYLIGSPDQGDGMTIEQVILELGIVYTPEIIISLVGIGMGNKEMLTSEAKQAIENADYLLGAKRMIEPYRARKEKKDIYLPEDILTYIQNKTGYITILFSGDSGFFSGCKKVYDRLKAQGYNNVRIYPGISSVSYLSSKTGIPWSEAEIFSIHGKGKPDKWSGQLYDKVLHNERTFLLLSGLEDVHHIAEVFSKVTGIKIILGRNLSYEDEQIDWLTPQQCMGITQEGLYTCIILNSNPTKRAMTNSHKDDEFIRGKVPMTKEEIRTISISKLGIKSDSTVWDIGSGTGSVAVEIAGYSPDIEVYAIEQKEEARELIAQNARKFNMGNVHVIAGKAPASLSELPAPSHVFIGGSGGELEEILAFIYEKNPHTRVVINAVSLETIAQVTQLVPRLSVKDFEAVSMSVSRSRSVGKYNLMQAENPVMIFSFTFCDLKR